MAIQGLITSQGVQETREAALNEGWKIVPLKFSVSNIQSALDPTRTSPNSGVWYEAPISSRVIVGYNTIKFVCTIPADQIPQGTIEHIREIYIFCQLNAADFLFAIGQPSTVIQYDPSGTVTLDLDISLTNNDLSSILVFQFTQATEIAEHNVDPNAHPEIIAEMNRAGQYLDAGGAPFTYRGQWYDKKANFQGNKASAVRGGIIFTAVYTGTDYNGLTITFDGIKTVNQVVVEFNNAHTQNPIVHNSLTGTEVLSAGSTALSGGTIAVNQNDVVYRDADGYYKKALADGSVKSKVAGIADITRRIVHSQGFFNITTGFAISSDIYLSDVIPGALKDTPTGIKLGSVLDTDLVLITGIGGVSGLLTQNYDAIVSTSPGYKYYSTTQAAISAVPNGGRILVDRNEMLVYALDTQGKSLNFTFNGPNRGWYKSPGQHEQQKIMFSAIPTSGTWRLEWNGQESADLAYNATAADVQAAFNMFTGHAGVTVTGNYSVGFTIDFLGFVDYPLPSFLDAGQNEIQRFNYSDIPDDGTIRLNFEGQDTANIAWNDTTLQYEAYVEALSAVNNVLVTGSFADGFHQIEFIGVDGLAPKSNFTVSANTLKKLGINVNANHALIQDGKYPASNLKFGSSPVSIVAIETAIGTSVGPTTAIILSASNNNFVGLGKIQNFENGIDFNGFGKNRIEMFFENTTNPLVTEGLLPGIDYDTSGSIGYHQDIFGQLKIAEHPTNKKRVKISGVDFTTLNGSKISSEYSNMVMKFDGAEIDFETGTIYKEDGVTALGINFTPVSIADGMYRWYALTLVPKAVTSDQKMEMQLLVTAASADGAAQDSAPRAMFVNGKKLGQVAIQGDVSGIKLVYQKNVDQLMGAGGSGSGGGSGGSGTTVPYILDLPTTSVSFETGTFTWSSPIGIINAFYGEYSIAANSISGINHGDILYSKLFLPQNLIADGTALGEFQVNDTTYFHDNDQIIIGDHDSIKVVGYVNGTPSGNSVFMDDGSGTPINLSTFLVAQGAWVIRTNTTLQKGVPNSGDLKPDSFGNIDASVYIVGLCVGGSIFLANGIEITRSWFYEETLLTSTAIVPGDVITLPNDSRNALALKYYKNGLGDLEVYLNGEVLDRSPVTITLAFQPSGYDNITGLLLVPDAVDLSYVKRSSVLVDALGGEHLVLGGVSNEVGNKYVTLSPGLTPSLNNGAYFYNQGFKESGTSGQLVNTIIAKTYIPAGNLIKFRVSPLINKSSGSGATTLAANLGTGTGVYKQKDGDTLKFRSIKAGTGITISVVGDDIIITATGGGGSSAFFVELVSGQTGTLIPTSSSYDMGTDKLDVYRNGVSLINSSSIGLPVDQYQEASSTGVSVGLIAESTDVFSFFNDDIAPVKQIITGITGTSLTVPSYVVGSKRLKIFRNGILMNAAGLGGAVDQYTEASSTSVTLGLSATSDEIFLVVILGYAPAREDITGQTGTVLTLSNSYTMGNDKLLVYKNGVLMFNSTTHGSTDDRYQETTNSSITLAASAVATDTFTFINKV